MTYTSRTIPRKRRFDRLWVADDGQVGFNRGPPAHALCQARPQPVRIVRPDVRAGIGFEECPMVTIPSPLLAIRHFLRPCEGQWVGRDRMVSEANRSGC
jgi:hypothetical protein